MSSPAHHEATKAAMKQQGCERITVNVGPQNAPEMRDVCDFCAEDWDTERDVCSVIDSAARIAYEMGQRDALNDAAEALDEHYDAERERIITENGRVFTEDDQYLAGIESSERHIRALASTPTNEGAETDG